MAPRRWIAALLTACALLPTTAAAATPPPARLSLTVDRTTISTQLGRGFVVRSTIHNRGPSSVDGLVAHLSVLSLRPTPYVDPEDWSPQRVVFVDPIPAGGSRTLRWRMTAVNAGTFGVYVTVLAKDARSTPAPNSPTIDVRVAERRTLNAGGILPLAIAIPALLAALAIILRLRRRD